VKEGKLARGQTLPGEDEPLHAYIQGPSIEVVAGGCAKIREIIRHGSDATNEMRANQLKQLAMLNGTVSLRENDQLNKLRVYTETQTIVTNRIVCTLCGSAGHPASDCKLSRPGAAAANGGAAAPQPPTWVQREKMDSEYHTFMAELSSGKDAAAEYARLNANDPGKCLISRNTASNSTAATILALGALPPPPPPPG